MNSEGDINKIAPTENRSSVGLQSLNVEATIESKQGNIKEDLLWDYGRNLMVFSRDKIITYGVDDLSGHNCQVNDCGR